MTARTSVNVCNTEAIGSAESRYMTIRVIVIKLLVVIER